MSILNKNEILDSSAKQLTSKPLIRDRDNGMDDCYSRYFYDYHYLVYYIICYALLGFSMTIVT